METVQRGIAARSMAKIPAYADGGVVSPYSIRGIMQGARKLFEPAPAETMTEKYAKQDAEFAAKNQPKPVVAPEPTAKPDVIDTIRARNKMMQGLKDGGPVKAGIIRGPGTGTSDSIKGKMKPGSFVMPKDSTDVMVSNGETNFTPEMVQKIGAVALMAMKDATHTPVSEKGEDPVKELSETSEANETYLKNGGEVKRLANGPDEEQQKQMGYTEQMRNVGSALINAPIEAAKTLVSAPGYGINKDPAPIAAPTQAPAVAPVQSQVTPGVSPTGGISAPVMPAAPTAPVQPAVAALAAPSNQVTRVGNSYTGAPNITGNVTIDNPRGGAISAQNQQAGQTLSDKYSAEARLAAPAPAGPQVFIGKDTGGYGILDKGYQRERSLSMAASNGSKEARAALLNYQSEQAATLRNDADRASKDAQAQLTADTQRVGYGVQAQNNQATQQNAAARLGIDRTNSTLANQQTTQQIGAAKQMQDLQTRLLTAKPEEREGVLDNLRAFQKSYDKPVADRFTAIRGAKTMDGQEGDRVFNNQTGQFVDGAQKQALPPGMVKQVGTSNGKPVYEDANGKRHS